MEVYFSACEEGLHHCGKYHKIKHANMNLPKQHWNQLSMLMNAKIIFSICFHKIYTDLRNFQSINWPNFCGPSLVI